LPSNPSYFSGSASDRLCTPTIPSSGPLPNPQNHACDRPGYFTTIAENEGRPVGNLFFAGEHTSSFYEWQGFMEGAALSGVRAAGEAFALLRGK